MQPNKAPAARQPGRTDNQNKRVTVCYTCGKTEHIARNCKSTKSESRTTTLNEPSTCQITSETERIASKSSGVDYKKPTKEEDEEEEVSPISLLFSSSEEEDIKPV